MRPAPGRGQTRRPGLCCSLQATRSQPAIFPPSAALNGLLVTAPGCTVCACRQESLPGRGGWEPELASGSALPAVASRWLGHVIKRGTAPPVNARRRFGPELAGGDTGESAAARSRGQPPARAGI